LLIHLKLKKRRSFKDAIILKSKHFTDVRVWDVNKNGKWCMVMKIGSVTTTFSDTCLTEMDAQALFDKNEEEFKVKYCEKPTLPPKNVQKVVAPTTNTKVETQVATGVNTSVTTQVTSK